MIYTKKNPAPLKCTRVVIIVTKLCDYHHYLIIEYFSPLKKKPCIYKLSLQSPNPWQPLNQLSVSNLLAVFMDLPPLDILYRKNPTIYGLLCLVYFTQHSVFKVHDVARVTFIPFHCQTTFHCMDTPHLIHSSVMDIGLSSVFGYYE